MGRTWRFFGINVSGRAGDHFRAKSIRQSGFVNKLFTARINQICP